MAVDVVVTGIGLLCSLGNLRESWKRLLAQESGIEICQPFVELPLRPLGLIGEQPSQLSAIAEPIVAAAVRDADLTLPLKDCGVVLGSSRGCQGTWEQFLATGSVPEAWLETLPHQGAIAAARYIGATGMVLAPTAACATGLVAIARGCDAIRSGQCDRVLAGAVEAPITPLTLAGFQRMGALAKTGCYPFDRQREGLVLAEGGAVLVLEAANRAIARRAPIYGRILDSGFTTDAYHVSAPDLQGRSATLAIKQCLGRSHLASSDIDYIHAHGTSTQLNDRNEAQLIQHLFPQPVAVSSTKGATGHALGASGAMGVAFCLMALREQILPPCVGLREPAFDLNFVTLARCHRLENLLCLSFGFGGLNGAIALSRF